MEARLASIQTGFGPASAARIHFLNLEHIKEKLGARWSRLGERVEFVARGVIALHLDRSEFYEQCSELDFLIVFPTLDRAAGALKCLAIARDISRRLFGEDDGVWFEIGTAVTNLAGMPTPLTWECVQAALSQPSAVIAAEVPTAAHAPACPEELPDPLDGLTVEFEPLWDTERQKFPIRIVRPVFKSVDALMLFRAERTAAIDEGEILERLDLALQARLVKSLDGYATLEAPALLSIPVHYQTLAKPIRRRRYVAGLSRIPEAVRKRLIVTIRDLPSGVLSMRLAEIMGPLAGWCLNVTVSVTLGFRDFAVIKSNRIAIVGCDLEANSDSDQAVVNAIPLFANGLKRAGLVGYLANVESLIVAGSARLTFRYVSGPAVAERQATLSPTVRLVDAREVASIPFSQGDNAPTSVRLPWAVL
jgi:hypothetical protein